MPYNNTNLRVYTNGIASMFTLDMSYFVQDSKDSMTTKYEHTRYYKSEDNFIFVLNGRKIVDRIYLNYKNKRFFPNTVTTVLVK